MKHCPECGEVAGMARRHRCEPQTPDLVVMMRAVIDHVRNDHRGDCSEHEWLRRYQDRRKAESA